MAGKETPKQAAIKALRDLTGVRVSGSLSISELFPFGFMPPLDGSERKYDDRTIAIITATVLEQALERALLTKLRDLDDSEERAVFLGDSAPLGTLSSKTTMAYALGLFGPQTRADLNIIREIRNTFAHSRLPITFEEPKIAEAFSFATLPDRWHGKTVKDNIRVGGALSTRQVFIETAFQYILALIVLAEPEDDEPYESEMPHGRVWSCLED